MKSHGDPRMMVRLIAGCLLPLLLALLCQALYTVSAQRNAMVGGLEDKAQSLATMMVNVTGPSLAVDDADGLKEGLSYIKNDDDVAFAAMVAPNAALLGFFGGANAADVAAALTPSAEESVTHWRDLIIAHAPVRVGSKDLGTVVVGFNTRGIDYAVRGMLLPAVGIALAGIAVAVAVVMSLSTALLRRNRDLKILMDNAGEGFLRVDRQGTLMSEHSAILDTWFGPWKEGQAIWEYLNRHAPKTGEWMQLMWENVQSDVLPVDVSLEQLPREVEAQGRSLEIAYKAIEGLRGVLNIMVVISDVTANKAQERSKLEQREQLALFTAMLRDRSSVEDYFSESRRLVKNIVDQAGADEMVLRRDLHTLKGNSASFGMVGLASLCHSIEDHLGEGTRVLSATDRNLLLQALQGAESMLESLNADQGFDAIELEPSDQARILQMIAASAPREDVENLVRGWSNKPVRKIFTRFAYQADKIARHLGKGEINTHIAAEGVRIPDHALDAFWTALGHVVNNAVDHGLEAGDERVKLGKARTGSIIFRASEKNQQFIVEIEDDGRGIDWDKLSERAKAAGLPHARHEDLLNLLYGGGVSTRDSVTEASGRGIGVGAVHDACVKSGGHLDVFSEPMRGTRFVFRWPASILHGPKS